MTGNELTEAQQLEAMIGHRLGPYLSFNPVNPTQIWQWCSAMGDKNPCYSPGDRQLAPPAMMQVWTMRDFNDAYAPGSTDEPPYQVFDDLKLMGYPANVAVSYDIRFHRYLLTGERARHYTTVVNISDRKTTSLGQGYFVTERVDYLTGDDNLFAEALISYFQYQPAQDQGSVEADNPPIEAASAPPVSDGQSWQPDFGKLDVSALSIGDLLPELAIPVTHRLIVGGAIATQDFIPVHHNLPAAQAAAMPDIFMNILTTSGLCARYLSDWAGADSRLRRLKFNLMAPNLPGDTMVMEGRISELTQNPSTTELVVEFGGRNSRGYHTRGAATLALPIPV